MEAFRNLLHGGKIFSLAKGNKAWLGSVYSKSLGGVVRRAEKYLEDYFHKIYLRNAENIYLRQNYSALAWQANLISSS